MPGECVACDWSFVQSQLHSTWCYLRVADKHSIELPDTMWEWASNWQLHIENLSTLPCEESELGWSYQLESAAIKPSETVSGPFVCLSVLVHYEF
jgi:hypothetical protein